MVGNSKASVLVRLEFNELIELVSCPRNNMGDGIPAFDKNNPRCSPFVLFKFRLEHLGSSLIVALGHEPCGTVAAVAGAKETGHIAAVFLMVFRYLRLTSMAVRRTIWQEERRRRAGNALLPAAIISKSHRQTNLSDIHQSALRRDRDRLSSANRVQLFQNNLHVVFHRVFADVKDLTDFFIALAESHLLEDLKFALGELRLRHGVRQLRGDIVR